MKKITLQIIAVLFSITVSAQSTTTFTGAVNNDWNEPGNWTNGVPNPDQTAIINEGSTVDISQPDGSRIVLVGGIQNSGTINTPEDKLFISTNTLNNSGVINVGNTIITSSTGDGNILNTGVIQSSGEYGYLTLQNASSISNEGDINTTTFTTENTGNFTNQEGANINTHATDINATNFGNYGTCNSEDNTSVTSEYAFNKGLIKSFNNHVRMIASKDYVRNYSKGYISAINGHVYLIGLKGLNTGTILTGSSDKSGSGKGNSSAGNIEMIVDTSWIVGDSVSMQAETIRFVFDYLHIFDIDSIKKIYAGSKIEFYGTEGSILNLMYNEQENFFWVEDGTIEIHSDSIATLDHGLNYYFSPEPIVGPSDTTFTQVFVQSRTIRSDADSSGNFNILIQNQSTANKIFDYTISSSLGWVESVSGTIQQLYPFQFDSLLINYDIPIFGDTLTDTIMIIVSVPGVYTDTTYSYIRSSPSMFVDIKETESIKAERLSCYPVPFSNVLFIQSGLDQKCKVFNTKGQNIETLNLKAGETNMWKPERNLPEGIYILINHNNKKRYYCKFSGIIILAK